MEDLTKKVELVAIQNRVKELEQVEMPLLHDFAPGLYLRQIFMPAGTLVIGKTHKTEHFNFVLQGSALVMVDGDLMYIKAPCVFKSAAGAKKALLIQEDMVWATTHPTDETDIEKLEEMFVMSEEEEMESLILQMQAKLNELEAA